MQNSNAVCRMSFTSPFIIHVSQNESATISFKAKKKKKNYIPFSPVSSWLLPISFVPIIFICTSPSPSLVIHIGCSFSSKRPLWITTPTPFFAETYWLFWWSRATLQKYSPSFYSNESARGEGQCADQCTNLNNLFPAARVSNTVSWGDYTALRSPVSFFFSGLPRLHGKKSISTCGLVAGTLSAPPLAYKLLASTGMNQMVGT